VVGVDGVVVVGVEGGGWWCMGVGLAQEGPATVLATAMAITTAPVPTRALAALPAFAAVRMVVLLMYRHLQGSRGMPERAPPDLILTFSD
jgi:hypothetical protein